MSESDLIQGEQRVIRPGDTLLVRLPGVEVIVIAAEGIDVYRPDAPAKDGPG